MIYHGYVHVHKDTGQVLSIRLPYGPAPSDNLIEGDRRNIALTSENIPNEQCLDFNYFCMHYYWNGLTNEFVYTGLPINEYATYDFASSSWTWDPALVLEDIRDKRDALLASCDWTQSPDSPLSAEKKAQWATYRQALRDFPETINGNPVTRDAVTYPTPPSNS